MSFLQRQLAAQISPDDPIVAMTIAAPRSVLDPDHRPGESEGFSLALISASGKRHERREDYVIQYVFASDGDIKWSGVLKKDPRVRITGTIISAASNTPTYAETTFHNQDQPHWKTTDAWTCRNLAAATAQESARAETAGFAEFCADIADPARRLACYDRTRGASAPPAPDYGGGDEPLGVMEPTGPAPVVVVPQDTRVVTRRTIVRPVIVNRVYRTQTDSSSSGKAADSKKRR